MNACYRVCNVCMRVLVAWINAMRSRSRIKAILKTKRSPCQMTRNPRNPTTSRNWPIENRWTKVVLYVSFCLHASLPTPLWIRLRQSWRIEWESPSATGTSWSIQEKSHEPRGHLSTVCNYSRGHELIPAIRRRGQSFQLQARERKMQSGVARDFAARSSRASDSSSRRRNTGR